VRISDVSRDCDASIFRVKQAKKKSKLLGMLDPEDGGTTILCKVRNYLPNDTA
jgi:hypothetical protein